MGSRRRFFAETLAIVEDYVAKLEDPHVRLIMKSPPTRLSAKFSAVAKAYDMSIEATDAGDWAMARTDQASATRDGP